MDMNRKMAILKTYGNILRSDRLVRPVIMWLHNNNGQRSCSGKGNTAGEDVDDLYMKTRAMLFSYVHMLENYL